MSAPDAESAQQKKASRYIFSGVLGIILGIAAFVVRSAYKDKLIAAASSNMDVAFELATNPQAQRSIAQMLDWSLYAGILLLVIGAIYLSRGLALRSAGVASK